MVFCQRVSVFHRWFPYAAGNRRSGRYYHSKFGVIWDLLCHSRKPDTPHRVAACASPNAGYLTIKTQKTALAPSKMEGGRG